MLSRAYKKAGVRVDAAFEQRIRSLCLDALEAAGFTRCGKEHVDWPMENGFHCWVSPNTARDSDRARVLPLVGVHVVPIMKLDATIEGAKYRRAVATYAINMGQLEDAADERAFAFSPEQSTEFIESEARRLADLYRGPGLQFARSIASYESLLPRLRELIPSLGGYPERTACCLCLMGRKEEARAFVEDFLSKEEDYFRGFAVPFLKMLNEGG